MPASSRQSADNTLPLAPRALLRRLEWQVQHAVSTSLSGNYRSVFRGKGMEFDQVVKYQWGDDMRDIDWNVTARLGEPYRKKFIEERELSIIFVFEDTPALQFGTGARSKRDVLMELAGLLMLLGATHRDRIGLFYSSPEQNWFQRPQSGRKSALKTAARLIGQPAPSLDGAAESEMPWRMIRRAASPGSVILWFGAFLPGEMPAGWRALQERCQTVGVRADDAWDSALPDNTRLSTYDPVAGRIVNLDTTSRATRTSHKNWKKWRESWFEKLFPQIDAQLKVDCEADTLQTLVRHFRQHQAGGRW